MDKLDPCPFCGENATLVCDNGPWLVECVTCRAASGRAPYEAKAIKFWNRRSPQGEAPKISPWSKERPCPWCKSCGLPESYHVEGSRATGTDGKICETFIPWEYESQAPGTARSQEAGTGAPGVRECWAYFYTHPDAPTSPVYWDTKKPTPSETWDGGAWVRMIEADNQAPRGQREGDK